MAQQRGDGVRRALGRVIHVGEKIGVRDRSAQVGDRAVRIDWARSGVTKE
jgi:hypothetical protein